MSISKNKSNIAASFKNLLKKADEMALEQKKDVLLDKNKITEENFNRKNNLDRHNLNIKRSRLEERTGLGIKNIKRVPSNPFDKNKKIKNEELEKYKKELMLKTSNILNRHIYLWLNRELPKYARIKLRKHIYDLLIQLRK